MVTFDESHDANEMCPRCRTLFHVDISSIPFDGRCPKCGCVVFRSVRDCWESKRELLTKVVALVPDNDVYRRCLEGIQRKLAAIPRDR
jgi:predicted Zn finger-like uncharacterized protein